MDSISVLLLNIVYGALFFTAFGVFIATMLLFILALWDTVLRKLFIRGSDTKEAHVHE